MLKLPERLKAIVLATIARLQPVAPTEVVDRSSARVFAQGVSADVQQLCGDVTSKLRLFAMGNGAAARATPEQLIELLEHGHIVGKFISTRPVPQQCYLLERGKLKVLLMIRVLS